MTRLTTFDLNKITSYAVGFDSIWCGHVSICTEQQSEQWLSHNIQRRQQIAN